MLNHSGRFVRRTALLAAALALAACENTGRKSSQLPDPLPSPGFQPPVTRHEQGQLDLSKEAQDLQAAFDQMNSKANAPAGAAADVPLPDLPPATKGQGRLGDQSGRNTRRNATPPTGVIANQAASVPEATAASEPPPRARKGDSERTPAQKRQDAIAELASQLKPGIDGAKEPLRAAMPLIGLDAISSNAGATQLDTVSRAVSADQRRTVDAVRELVRSLATDPNLASADPAPVARLLRDKADQLAGTSPRDELELGAVALCQRVDGFGRFTTLGTTTFLAGRPNAMIVYSEIQNFSQTRGSDAGPSRDAPDQWRVELGQTVKLYLDSDGSEQLVVPESVVRDSSMSKRHDFFLVQRVDLPRNLSVGNYNLKVTVRDIAHPAIVERVIPIRIVADVSALTERSPNSAGVKAGGAGTSSQFAGSGVGK